MVIDCPYSGKVDPVKVKDVTQALLDMGCYEVSLGDTVGTGNPTTIRKLLHAVLEGTGIPASALAVCLSFPSVAHDPTDWLPPGPLSRHVRDGRL